MGVGEVIAAAAVGIVVYFIIQALFTAYNIKDILAPLLFGLGVPFFLDVVAFCLALLLLSSWD